MVALSDKTMVFRGGEWNSFYQPKLLTVVLASQLLFSRDNGLRHAAHARRALGKLDFMGQMKMGLEQQNHWRFGLRYAQRLEGQYHVRGARELGIALPSIEVITVDIMSGEQFSNAFTAVSGNQKIPGLVWRYKTHGKLRDPSIPWGAVPV